MAETANWYVVHTYSGYEGLVKDTLNKMVENNALQDQILDIRILEEQTIEEKNGKKKIVYRKVLPGYLFIKLVYSNNLWYLITNTRGVTGFVGPQGKAVPLTEDEIKRMRLEDKLEVVDFEIKDKVIIVSGPMDGFDGEIIDLNIASQKAKVKVSMFGTETEVEVDLVQLKKVNPKDVPEA